MMSSCALFVGRADTGA